MKKILATTLSAVMVVMSAVSVSGATVTTEPTSDKRYSVIGTDTIPDNTVRLYSYGTGIDSSAKIVLTDNENSSETVIPLSETDTPSEATVPSTRGYKLECSSCELDAPVSYNACFNNSGGTYQKIRLKLSDFSDRFFDNGEILFELYEENCHTFNFTDEGDGYCSTLLFVSGAAMTFAVPDENGYVEFYASTNIGDGVKPFVNYRQNGKGFIVRGYDPNISKLNGFTVGDIDENNEVTIIDATTLQKSITGLETLDTGYLAQRRADTDRNGTINIMDVTAIQKSLVE